MPQYRYTAKDSGGKTQNGILDAANINTFYQTLKQQELYCLTVEEVGANKDLGIFQSKMKISQLAIFCRQLSTMLSAGLTVTRSLDILYQQSEDKNMKKIILSLYESVQRGDQLSVAMKKNGNIFPDMMVYMFEAGEQSGTIDEVAKRLADNYEKEYKLTHTISNAFMYPIILSIVTVLVVIVLLTFVLPTITSFYTQSGAQLPAITTFLMNLSDFIITKWYVLILLFLIIFTGVKLLLSTPDGRLFWDTNKLKLPIIGGLLDTINVGRFARTMASLFSSGLPLLLSLETTAKIVGNAFVTKSIDQIRDDVRRGMTLTAAMKKSGAFPIMLVSMINIGEETGALDSVLVTTANIYDESSENAIKKMVALIEPVMIVVLAVVVGFIILAMITPMFGMYSLVSQ